ncbi:gas vesicle protein [Micromonospora okii]|uniref:gas vesicle protein n=1 Tax=Micromonospora okii TaxID=1182970 RepID=UPI001E5523EF|nr:gas vesicle protein [Micromonospora okii]
MVTTALAPSSADDPLAYRPVALVDVLDRVLASGVVVSGDITIAIAEVDLVRISLRALVASAGALVRPEQEGAAGPGGPAGPGGTPGPEGATQPEGPPQSDGTPEPVGPYPPGGAAR